MRQRIVPILLLLLALAGVWQGGAGLWIHAKAWLAQQLLEQAWVKTQAGVIGVKPWPWADTWPVARLENERLGVGLIVLAGNSGQALAFGPGHSSDSALPGGRGTVVISAHRDTHFRFLRLLQPGDTLLLEDRRGRFRYRVSETAVIDSTRQGLVDDPEGQRLALVTCYPFDAIDPGGPLRYLVMAELVPDSA